MSSPLISVIVPIYNVAPYLADCVDSIINQTYTNLEIILVDDGSTDGCGAMCDEYAQKDARIRVIHKQNGGQSSARNAGMDIMTGEYVAFVDSDDWLRNDTYSLCMDIFAHSTVDVVKFGFLQVYPDQTTSGYMDGVSLLLEGAGTILRSLIYTNKLGGVVTNALFRSEVLSACRFREGYIHEDEIYILKIFSEERIQSMQILPQQLYYYRRLREGATTSRFNERNLTNLLDGLFQCVKDANETNKKNVALSNAYLLKMASAYYPEIVRSPERQKLEHILHTYLQQSRHYPLPSDWRIWDLRFFRRSPKLHLKLAWIYQGVIRRLKLSEQYT